MLSGGDKIYKIKKYISKTILVFFGGQALSFNFIKIRVD